MVYCLWQKVGLKPDHYAESQNQQNSNKLILIKAVGLGELLTRLLSPSGIFKYSDITNMVVKDRSVSLSPDEWDIKPAVYSGQKLTPKLFYTEQVIQGFPVRNKALLRHILRSYLLAESQDLWHLRSCPHRMTGLGGLKISPQI